MQTAGRNTPRNKGAATRVAVLFLYASLIAPLASAFSAVRLQVSSMVPRTSLLTPRLHVSSSSTRNAFLSANDLSDINSSSSSPLSAAATSKTSTSSSSSPMQTKKTKKSQATLEGELPWDWQAVVQHVWDGDLRPIIMFDGECNLCNGGVNMLLDMDTNNEFRFCSLASKFGQSLLVAHGKDPEDRNSIMVVLPTGITKSIVDDDVDGNHNEKKKKKIMTSNYFDKSEAVMAIASKLAGAPSWVKAMTAVGNVAPIAVSDWLLQVIADNRYRVAGKHDQCRLDLDGEYEGRFLNDHEHEHLFQAQQ